MKKEEKDKIKSSPKRRKKEKKENDGKRFHQIPILTSERE
jgi:hypothetical protein